MWVWAVSVSHPCAEASTLNTQRTHVQLLYHHCRHKKLPQANLSTFPVPSNVALRMCIVVRLHTRFAGCNRGTFVIATRTQAQHHVRVPSSRWITPMQNNRSFCQRLEKLQADSTTHQNIRWRTSHSPPTVLRHMLRFHPRDRQRAVACKPMPQSRGAPHNFTNVMQSHQPMHFSRDKAC